MQKELDFINTSQIAEKLSSPLFILIIDTETTGLDSEQDQCIEVGAVLFHVASRSVIAQNSFLIPSNSNAAESINRISPEVTKLTESWKDGLTYFNSLLESADVVLAHNASFDKKWFGKYPLPDILKPWICSMEDIPWPSDLHLRARPSVKDLALAYEVPVWSAHRALTDCIYLVEVLRRCTNLEDLLEQALEPRRLMRADISYEERHLAKKAGFQWNEPIRGAWTRRLSEREIMKLPFPVNEIQF
ncbi:3'-5' exonuclease [Prochlorococcus marinus]|uniref:3'-5' exonuclease n=1 Tax=Prochlorococcus marinus TaxID=1219 RepID=UPI0022B32E6B|nr:3'-5' exonuclease [Prochlorococcus marinus]